MASVAAEEPDLAGDELTSHRPRYPLRSLPQSSLLLKSPLRSPRRLRRRIILVLIFQMHVFSESMYIMRYCED